MVWAQGGAPGALIWIGHRDKRASAGPTLLSLSSQMHVENMYSLILTDLHLNLAGMNK